MHFKITLRLLLLTLFPSVTINAQSGRMTTKNIALGDSMIQIISSLQATDSKTLFLNIHEDEQTSIAVAQNFAKQHPLNFIYLHHNQTRRITYNINRKKYSVDPNRIYTNKGRQKTIQPWWRFFTKHALTQAKHLSDEILTMISPYQIIVSMHNNTDVNYSIKSYLPGESESQNTADVFISEAWDPDDFIYTTDQRFFDYLKGKNVNVILQDNNGYVNDGSLSVYCGKKGIPYINIEAQKGHFDEQYRLTEIVHNMLAQF